MKKLITICVVAGLMLSLTCISWAIPIIQTQYFSGTPDMIGASTFNQFDNNGGTYILNSVQVSLYLQTTGGQLVLDNDSDLPASGTFEFGAKGTLSSTDVALLNSSAMSIPGQVTASNSQAFSLDPNIGDGPGDFSSASPDGLLYIGGTQDDAKSGLVGSAFWSSGAEGFLGTGTYDINHSITQWLTYGSIGGIEYAVSPVTADGYVEVVYDYSVIPEPATICILGLGALSLIRKK